MRILWISFLAALIGTSIAAKAIEVLPDDKIAHKQTQQTLLDLSAQKWKWMAEKNVEELANLFDDTSKFVHMSGTWNKQAELDIIESGRIWYKKAEGHGSVVKLFGDTAIVWNRITLEAVVRENTVSNEFTVTEVYQQQGESWKLLGLTFSKVRDTHVIAQ